jgi:nucleoside-diphosphate-sugar epimerase
MPSLLITGGLGFLGQQAARHFLKGGVVFSRLRNELAPLTQLTLFDVAGSTTLLPELARDSRVRVVEGDLAEPGTASELVCASGDVSIIHLASMVSGNTETDTEEGW